MRHSPTHLNIANSGVTVSCLQEAPTILLCGHNPYRRFHRGITFPRSLLRQHLDDRANSACEGAFAVAENSFRSPFQDLLECAGNSVPQKVCPRPEPGIEGPSAQLTSFPVPLSACALKTGACRGATRINL